MHGTKNKSIEQLEGRTFILGREGHIYIDSPSASKHHAEIRIKGGKIHLRDLNSSNGTYLLKNKKLVYFERGYVSPLQRIVIGNQEHIILDLLAIASNFVASDDAATELYFHQQDTGKQAS
ncbi:MAG: FHA domain-containing protein [Gammaproteobacteria bacterium]|nr:FHA domain-containing protein [Gammaproteobacteria bacterium]